MRNHPPFLVTLLLALSFSAVTGCSKEAAPPSVARNQVAPAEPVPPPAAPPAITVTVSDPCAEMKSALASATFEQHTGLADVQARMDREIDTQVAAKKAAGADVSQAAGEKLDTACEDFAEKVRMLSVASAETWDSAKHNTELSLQNVSDAYNQVMNSPPRK
jgi:hypothetical protein